MYDTFKVHFYLWLNYPKTVALIFHVIAIVFCIEAGYQIALSAECRLLQIPLYWYNFSSHHETIMYFNKSLTCSVTDL